MSGGLQGVRAADIMMEDIKYFFTSTVEGQGPVSHTGLQVRPCTDREGSRVQVLCGLPGVLPGCFILPRDDLFLGVQSHLRHVWQKLQHLGTVDGQVFER